MPYQNTSIIFDLDGTLVDSAPDLLSATNHVMQYLDLSPIEMDAMRNIISNGAKAMIARGGEVNGKVLSDDDLDKLLPVFLEYYDENIAVNTRVFDGVINILESIKEAGGTLGVCTNKREKLALRVLEELELLPYFSAVVGYDTLEVRKPHPGHLLGTIERVNGNPARSVMIGDSAPDIETAKAANIPVVAVSFGYSEIALEDLAPDAIINNYNQLPEVLMSFLHNNPGS